MNGKYEAVIGLEVHCELATRSKVFCGCKNEYGAPPNTLCCPVCAGLPGALPVLNAQVVEYALKMGLALGCRVNTPTWQDRKHYFYPDLPKAYQISQYDAPICVDGRLEVLLGSEVRHFGIHQLHIEEDAGKLLHGPDGETLIDLNRCGVPLIEIVTEPDMRSADEAKAALEAITLLLRYLGISSAKMQEGSVRADVNVSLRERGGEAYGQRTEMKNINSFMAVHRAISYEIGRQEAILEEGGRVAPQTRGWDDAKGESFLMRSKEEMQDYRYFADPDLPPYHISETTLARIKSELPELPVAKMLRYQSDYALPEYDATQLCAKPELAVFFEETVAAKNVPAKPVANWLLGDVAKVLNEENSSLRQTKLTPEKLGEMISLIENGKISGAAGKALLPQMMAGDKSVEALMAEMGLVQISDETMLLNIAQRVLAENTEAVKSYQAGKKGVLGYLVGLCMKESGGKANPRRLDALLRQMLDGPESP